MEYKPGILLQERFNPPDEVKSIAKWCAERGIKGKIGDRLPEAISSASHDWINRNIRSFQRLIFWSNKALRNGGN